MSLLADTSLINTLSHRVRNLSEEVVSTEQTMARHIFRAVDGTGNSLERPESGVSHTVLPRASGSSRRENALGMSPSPRSVSNSVCAGQSLPSSLGLSDMTWVFGQLVDHMLVHTLTDSSQAAAMTTPADDAFPGLTIPFHRSQHVLVGGLREQENELTSFLDASVVYGSDSTRSRALRRMDGSGKLLTSVSGGGEALLPLNVDSLPNSFPDGMDATTFFLAGDVRANENVALLGLHTVLVREHNRLCDEMSSPESGYAEYAGKGQMLYQHARRLLSGMLQNIVFSEFLPALGVHVPAYTGYRPEVDPSVSTEFATVGYRIGHTMIASSLRVSSVGGSATSLPLRDAFFNPGYVQAQGVDRLLHGSTRQLMQEVDGVLTEDVRSFLFGPPTSSMLHDLAALNIQRGRDHQIAGYNALRAAYGLPLLSSFQDVPAPASVVSKLEQLYASVDDIDPWVGALVETHAADSGVGPLVNAILVDQFTRCRDGDRFYFENDSALSVSEKALIRDTRLSDILSRNTGFEYAGDVFRV